MRQLSAATPNDEILRLAARRCGQLNISISLAASLSQARLITGRIGGASRGRVTPTIARLSYITTPRPLPHHGECGWLLFGTDYYWTRRLATISWAAGCHLAKSSVGVVKRILAAAASPKIATRQEVWATSP